MQRWTGTVLRSLLVPGGLLLFSAALLAHTHWLTLPLPALSFLYYCALIGGMLLAWRFHSSRMFLAVLTLFLAQQAIGIFLREVSPGLLGWQGLEAVAFLIPVNFLLISLMHERGFTVSSTAPVLLVFFIQGVILTVLSQSSSASVSSHTHRLPAVIPLSQFSVLAYVGVGIFLLAKCLLTRKPADNALLWALAAFWLSFRYAGTQRISTVYAVASVVILITAIIENSYLLAYHDELTTLPSRRAFNEALLRLPETYSIAVVDIDHFKRFNDTYGHDVGDQVLRLVATCLAQVTGGGEAYRCGGEEFNIVFPGKTLSEVRDHLEQLRRKIELSEFRMRGNDRRHLPRGPDRRNQRSASRAPKAGAIRQFKLPDLAQSLSVTVSIGVAASTKDKTRPQLILEAADKALYRAKANGRNRVETAASARQTSRDKTAGIA